jgi:hypothetical protein
MQPSTYFLYFYCEGRAAKLDYWRSSFLFFVDEQYNLMGGELVGYSRIIILTLTGDELLSNSSFW